MNEQEHVDATVASAAAIIEYGFDGDRLEVITTPNGEHWAVLGRLCEPFEIDSDGQRRKLLGLPWACTKIILVQVGGQGREVFCLNLRSIAGWLFTLNVRKVAPHLRDKLIRYQCGCAEALSDHFLGPRHAGAAAALPEEVRQALALLPILLERVLDLEERIAALSVQPAGEHRGPELGAGAARHHILDPLRQIARVKAKAIKREDGSTVRSLRFVEDLRLRAEVGFPMRAAQRWERFPLSRLGDVACVIARMKAEADRLAGVAAGRTKQLHLHVVR